jgi:hypothetical protein
MWVYLRVLAFVLSALGPVSVARAWANARVDQANVTTELLADGRARVLVELALAVDGGWVEALELPGFEGVVAVDPDQPATLVQASGRELHPQLELGASGGLVVRFARREAPRRGEHRLRFAYLADPPLSADPEGGLRLAFTLPGWEAGLRKATVVVVAPLGTRALPEADEPIAPQSRDVMGRTELVFERVHLPRRTPWVVRMALPVAGDTAPATADQAPPARAPWAGAAIAVWVLALSHAARRCRRVLGVAHGYLALPRGMAELAALAGAAWWLVSVPLALLSFASAAVALALWWPSERAAFGRRVLVPAQAVREARSPGARLRDVPMALLDATTVPGAAALGLVLTMPALVGGSFDLDGGAWALGLACAAPAWFGGTRLATRPQVRDALGVLAARAEAWQLEGWALRLTWLERVSGVDAPRLGLVPAVRLTGVRDLSLRVGVERELVLEAVLDAPLAERCAAEFAAQLHASHRGVGGRVALELAGEATEPVLSWLREAARERARAFTARAETEPRGAAA